ncbi:hypothetical protein HOC80_02220 [archaeon]|jgi:lipid-A-disaccharide synthase-like uncharacterized protein|nr:hypothetical protein [archaeon]MBT4416895.1 hypothetical protein [archaeon]
MEWIGYAALFFLIIAWLVEAVDLIKNKKGRLDVKFATFFIIGSILMLIYSIQIKNTVYIIMKSIVLFLSCLSLYYTLELHKKKKK